MHRLSVTSSTFVLASALLLSACTAKESAEDTATDTASAEAQPANAQAAATPGATSDASATAESSMTVEDIDRWQKGMTAELAAVREAGAKFKAAKNATDSMSAMMAANETSTRAAGARGAGIDENRYNTVRSSLSQITRYLAPLSAEWDVSKIPTEMRTTMQKDKDSTAVRIGAAYPPAVIEALRPRAEALRKQEMALVGERLKAAGMAP